MTQRPDEVAESIRKHLRNDSKYLSPHIDHILRAIGTQAEVLYHYTSAKGLLGILQSSRLHATDVRYMNDERELAHGLELVSESFEEWRTQQKTPLRHKILRGINLKSLISRYDIYAHCLSANRDQLSQWRGYAAEGTGYAIGFMRTGLEELTVEDTSVPAILVRMDYSSNAEGTIAYLEGILLGHEEAEKEGKPFTMASSRRMIEEILLAESLKFKNSAFVEEKEWRLCSLVPKTSDLPPEFLPRWNTLAPFVKFKSPAEARLPIFEIVLGPGTDKERTHAALKRLVHRYGYDNVHITESEAPYRT